MHRAQNRLLVDPLAVDHDQAHVRCGKGCCQTDGDFAKASDGKREFREARLYQAAPISTNLILSYIAEHVLGLPRSY